MSKGGALLGLRTYLRKTHFLTIWYELLLRLLSLVPWSKNMFHTSTCNLLFPFLPVIPVYCTLYYFSVTTSFCLC